MLCVRVRVCELLSPLPTRVQSDLGQLGAVQRGVPSSTGHTNVVSVLSDYMSSTDSLAI